MSRPGHGGAGARIYPALLSLLLAAGCAEEPSRSPGVIATVGQTEVVYTDFASFVERQTDSPVASLESPVLSSLLDQYLDELLLTRLAAERGLVEEEAARSGAPDGARRGAREALLAASPVPRPSREEVRGRYEEEKERFTAPERVRLWQILVEDRETAERVVARLEAGADFAEVARRHSVDPSAPYGGLQGDLAREDVPVKLAPAIFVLEPGEVSGVVEADYGFHVFMVSERLPERVLPFEEAAPEIETGLWEERLDRRLRELVNQARSRYTLEVYEENLPFEYRGRHEGEADRRDDRPEDRDEPPAAP